MWITCLYISPPPIINACSDVFLYLLNAAIYYGLDVHDLTKKITDVQNENLKRLLNE